jgi:hypothetical protein
MSRGSFSRSVARAASSGGGKAYGSRSPIAWYLVLTVIVVLGASLVVYSRYEHMHLKSTTTATKTIGPTASDHWQMAYAIDICGKVQPALPANSNLASVGIRTFGTGLIDINPDFTETTADQAKFEGAKATLGLFASSYPGLTLTADSIKLPGAKSTLWINGVDCPGKNSPVGHLQAKVWSSSSATGKLLTTSIPALHLTNGAMVTIAFVPIGTAIPEPPSKSALIAALGSSK